MTAHAARTRPSWPCTFGAIAVWACAAVSARAVPDVAGESALSSAAEPDEDPDVRRWEYVVLVRTRDEMPAAIGNAEAAAFEAGGAVLERLLGGRLAGTSDYRLLIRTRRPEAINGVLRRMRQTSGVVGATAVRLPETPTRPGGPGFMSSYTWDGGGSDEPGVIVKHDIPPVLDRRDLLEQTPLPTGPAMTPEGPGGFTLNVSELFKRIGYRNWQRREQRMKNAYLPILPSDPEDGAGQNP